MTDYRGLRPSTLSSQKFSHLRLLLFWPIYGIIFFTLEKNIFPAYTEIYCGLDDLIPFCELFIIPYYLWFAFLVGMMLYGLLFDAEAFKNYMYFTIITYSVTCIVYIIFPNSQGLRPTEFARDNVFVDIVRAMYTLDTNTNVCPSLHVLGSFAVLFSAWHSKHLRRVWMRAAILTLTLLITASTVFLKQHSIIDVAAALVLSALAYPFVFCKGLRKKITKKDPHL
jgi:membrane-associated phospholipid phosphatase